MSDTLHPLRTPVDPVVRDLARVMHEVCEALACDWFLTGALAREILLVHIYGCLPGRETLDADFAVHLPDWNAFESLKAAVLATNHFKPDPKVPHRMVFRAGTASQALKVDLVPFGGLADAAGRLVWPPDGSNVMDVQGYRVAHESCIRADLGAGLTLPLASSPGQVVMKLLAWSDQGLARGGRDAQDFMTLLKDHHRVLGDDALFDRHLDDLERFRFDGQMAAAFLLGKEVGTHTDPDLRKDLEAIVAPARREHLLTNMVRGDFHLDSDAALAHAESLLDTFQAGLQA
jgi:predicted nucleotidyltransferase